MVEEQDYGKVTVGLEGTATYHLLDDADGANTRNYSDARGSRPLLRAAFFLRSGGQWRAIGLRGATHARLQQRHAGQDGRRNIVRYDLPRSPASR